MAATPETFAIEHGLKIFPLNNKIPPKGYSWSDPKMQLSDPSEIFEWTQKGFKSWAIPCLSNDLIVIDCDTDKQTHEPIGENNLKTLFIKHDLMHCFDEAFKVRSPSGGLHLYFRGEAQRIKNTASVLADGIDTRASGGYIVCVYSITDNGQYLPYEGDLDETFYKPIPHIPSDLMAFLLEKVPHEKIKKQAAVTDNFEYKGTNLMAEKRFRDCLIRIRSAPVQKRNSTLSEQSYSSFMLRRYIEVEVIERDLIRAGSSIGLRHGEVISTVASAKSAALKMEPDDFRKYSRSRHKREAFN